MAARFRVGAGGNWSDTAHWSTTTGGGGGSAVPVSADNVTFDANSTGTTTVDASVACNQLNLVAGFAGTLDFSVNNNTCAVTTSFSMAAGTLSMGPNTWNMQGNTASIWAVTGGTLNANTSTLQFSGTRNTTNSVTLGGAGYSYYNISVTSVSSGVPLSLNGPGHITNNLNVVAGACLGIGSGTTVTLDAGCTLTVNGSSSSPILVTSSAISIAATLSIAGAISAQWCAVRMITFSGAGTVAFTSSLDAGGNTVSSVATITPPSGSRGFVSG